MRQNLFQDAREVNTKFSKTFTTFFFPVGNDDPLFPKTNVVNGDDKMFQACGLKREHWSTASPIRTIIRNAFKSAGLPYFNPHSFRNTLVTFGQKMC